MFCGKCPTVFIFSQLSRRGKIAKKGRKERRRRKEETMKEEEEKRKKKMDRKEEEGWREKDNRQKYRGKRVLSMTQFKFLWYILLL